MRRFRGFMFRNKRCFLFKIPIIVAILIYLIWLCFQPKIEDSVLFGSCPVHPDGPWSESVLKFAKPELNPKEGCKNFTILTGLQNGKVSFHPSASPKDLDEIGKCEGRCVFMKTEWYTKLGNPIVFYDKEKNFTSEELFKCDIVEVACSSETDPYVPFYRYIHHQIFEYEGPRGSQVTVSEALKRPSNPATKQETSDKKTHVVLLIMDSLSDFHFERALPKTKAYLEKRLGGIRFRRNSKIGGGSWTNGQAMLFDRVTEIIDRTPFRVPSIPEDISYEDACYKPSDNNEKFIFNKFEEEGYRTFFAEDWRKGIFMHPNCEGFQEYYAHHLIRPLLNRREFNKTGLIINSMDFGKCWLMSEEIVQWLNNSLNSYPGQPKFTAAWITETAHDTIDFTYSQDSLFLKFLQDNEKILNDSFIIMTGDHGKHWGEYRQNSTTGEYEEKNPMFFITVPQELRKNSKLMENLRKNSNQLMTHFDTYATLLDITKNLPKSKFTDFEEFDLGTRGKSILRSFGEEQRSCKNLPIDFAYCPCVFPQQKDIFDEQTMTMFGEAVVAKINALTEKHPGACAQLSLNSTIDVYGFTPHEETKVYDVYIRANPSEGEFMAFVSIDRSVESIVEEYLYSKSLKGVKVSEAISRINEYGKQGDCMNEWRLRRMCYCNDPETKAVESILDVDN